MFLFRKFMKNVQPIRRNTSWPNIFSSRTGSHSLVEQLHTEFFDLCWQLKLQIWTFSPSFSSLDISSLLTNVPQAKTIWIWADTFYSSEHLPVPFPRQIFVELMEMAASSVEFSFDNIMHRQVDGVTVGSPFNHPLPIFVGYYESELFQSTSKPKMYYRYMDDTFVVFSYEDECNLSSDSSTRFSSFYFWKESTMALRFLDVLVEKSLFKFITFIYRKPTFTG